MASSTSTFTATDLDEIERLIAIKEKRVEKLNSERAVMIEKRAKLETKFQQNLDQHFDTVIAALKPPAPLRSAPVPPAPQAKPTASSDTAASKKLQREKQEQEKAQQELQKLYEVEGAEGINNCYVALETEMCWSGPSCKTDASAMQEIMKMFYSFTEKAAKFVLAPEQKKLYGESYRKTLGQLKAACDKLQEIADEANIFAAKQQLKSLLPKEILMQIYPSMFSTTATLLQPLKAPATPAKAAAVAPLRPVAVESQVSPTKAPQVSVTKFAAVGKTSETSKKGKPGKHGKQEQRAETPEMRASYFQ